MKTPLISIFLPSVHGGGAERAMLMFAQELIKLQFSVDLVLANLEGALEDQLPPGVRVFNLRSPRMLRALPGLVRYLRERQPTAIFSTITHANIAATWATRYVGLNAPVIVRQSNTPISEAKGSWGRLLTGCLIPYVYRLADGVIAVSDGVREELVEMNAKLQEVTSVLPTPVLTPEILAQADERIQHPWFAEPDVPVIVSAGRLKRHKGMVELVRAFARLRRERRARLMILGEGGYRPQIEAEIRSLEIQRDVELAGFFNNPFPYMKQASLFVLASHYEGLPNVLIQALAFGTPVVATDCKSGPAEILEQGKWGRLVPVGDEDALVDAMRDSLHLPRQAAAQQSAWERYGAAEATRRYLAVAGLDVNVQAGCQEA